MNADLERKMVNHGFHGFSRMKTQQPDSKTVARGLNVPEKSGCSDLDLPNPWPSVQSVVKDSSGLAASPLGSSPELIHAFLASVEGNHGI
jgi:hypothetical protein